MPDVLQVAAEGFQLTKRQRSLIIRVFWVVGVSTHIAWACGLLTFIGLEAPFAFSKDVAKEIVVLQTTVANLKDASNISAATGIAQEIRTQVALRCTVTEDAGRAAITVTIERLQSDYIKYSPLKQRYPEPPCP